MSEAQRTGDPLAKRVDATADVGTAPKAGPASVSSKAPTKKRAEPLVFSDAQIDGIAQIFQDRAGDAKRTANVGIVITIGVGISILLLFIYSGFSNVVADENIPVIAGISRLGASVIVRIGAVLIGIFLMQVMINFVRYNTRMYFHWAMCSALIRLSRGNHEIIRAVAATLLPSSIDFGKMPTSPSDKVIEGLFGSVKELAKKIPSRV